MTIRQLLILSHVLVAFVAAGIAGLSPIANSSSALVYAVVWWRHRSARERLAA